MARYFFHVRQDRTVFEDPRGCEFPDIVAAWHWAMSDVRAIVREGQLQGSIDQQWIDIADETGAIVASLPFVRVLQPH